MLIQVGICLNRTFYGIETGGVAVFLTFTYSLNRTFYGIETSQRAAQGEPDAVLIVPFMELKQSKQSE